MSRSVTYLSLISFLARSDCRVGTYSQSSAASLSCDSCPLGSYSSAVGSTSSCVSCPAGTYSSTKSLSSGVSLAPSAYLQLYYRFDSVSGTRVGDTANGSVVYDATLQNGATVSNNQLKLSASQNQYMSINSFTTDTAGLTFTTWWKSESSSDNARVFDFGNSAGSDNIFISRVSANVYFAVYNSTRFLECNRMTMLVRFNQNSWNHVAWTLDLSGTWVAYINGVLITSATSKAYPRSVSRSNNYLGRSNWATDAYFNGFIKDFRMYKRVLSGTEVGALFNATRTISIGADKCTNCSTGQYSFPGSASCLIYPTASPTSKFIIFF